MLLQKQSGCYREDRRDGTHPHPSCPVPAARKQHAPSLRGRVDQAFSFQSSLQICPNARAGLVIGAQELGSRRNGAQIRDQLRAVGTSFQVDGMLTHSVTVDHLWQDVLKFRTRHGSSLPDTFTAVLRHGLMAFSALLVFRSSRNFIRALCSCDLLLPMEQPTISAISLCSNPSTS